MSFPRVNNVRNACKRQRYSHVSGMSLFSDEKLEDSDGYNYFFVVIYVLESK